jgi:hypothetical protein
MDGTRGKVNPAVGGVDGKDRSLLPCTMHVRGNQAILAVRGGGEDES